MAASRAALIKTGLISDVGTISALVTLAGVLGALMLFWAARAVRLTFLFERPAPFRLAPKGKIALQPARSAPTSPFAPAEARAQSLASSLLAPGPRFCGDERMGKCLIHIRQTPAVANTRRTDHIGSMPAPKTKSAKPAPTATAAAIAARAPKE